MKKYDAADLRARAQRAVELFMSGYNCSQSVVCAFADLYGFTPSQARLMSASFGGGMGRLRLTCGSCSGLCQLAGLEVAPDNPADQQAKAAHYAVVQQLAARFKEQTGSLICAEILKARMDHAPSADPTPDERNADYYRRRPCARMVSIAANIFADFLIERYAL